MKLPLYRKIVALGICVSAFAALLGGSAAWYRAIQPQTVDAAPRHLMGWAGPAVAKEAFEAVKDEFIPFRIAKADGVPVKDNSKSRVVLWDADKVVNNGQHLPTFKQEIGDCVGAGATQAVYRLMNVQIALNGAGEEFRPIFEPYHYACGRCAPEAGSGRMGRDPSGSTGSWQAAALKIYGVIPQTPELPLYNAKVVSQWATKMPAAEYIAIGKQHVVQSAAQVKTAEEVRDAICNGYPVTIASNWGGSMRPTVKDGKLVNRRTGTWNHQMCIIGYDGTGPVAYWYILNSWGADAFPAPPDDAPPGGFWVAKADVDYIVRQGDSFALSAFNGFPAQEWLIIRFDDALGRVVREAPVKRQVATIQSGKTAQRLTPVKVESNYSLAP